MPFWVATLSISGIVLFCTGLWALIVRRAGYRYVTAGWFRLLQNSRFLLYAVSGFIVGLGGTWLDGVWSGLIVATIDGTLGWWLSAALLKPMLRPLPRSHLRRTVVPLAIIVPLLVGPLFGGIGAALSLLWK